MHKAISYRKVTPGSLAAKSGIQSGDVLIAVDGQFVRDLSQDECEAKVRQARGSLHLKLEKYKLQFFVTLQLYQ